MDAELANTLKDALRGLVIERSIRKTGLFYTFGVATEPEGALKRDEKIRKISERLALVTTHPLLDKVDKEIWPAANNSDPIKTYAYATQRDGGLRAFKSLTPIIDEVILENRFVPEISSFVAN